MKLFDEYFDSKKKIHEYFGYVEDWAFIPLDDARKYFWCLYDEFVGFAETERELELQDGKYYEIEVYKVSFMPKSIYETDYFTMICVNTGYDGKKFLLIFDNKKKREHEE